MQIYKSRFSFTFSQSCNQYEAKFLNLFRFKLAIKSTTLLNNNQVVYDLTGILICVFRFITLKHTTFIIIQERAC